MQYDYFLEHVHDVQDGHMLWPFSTLNGYGRVWRDGRNHYVHILACETWHGPRPPGTQASHGPCPKTCWNGAHLRWATPSENNRDKVRDGTHQIGSRNGCSKLTEEQVLDIKIRYARGETQHGLGAEYGVSRVMIGYIVNGKKWKHVIVPGSQR